MKVTSLFSIENLKQSKFLLLGILSGLIVIQLTLIWRADDSSLWGMSTLFWMAILYLLRSKADHLRLESDAFASICGITLIALILVKSLTVSGYDVFLRISPLISAFGVALMASGFQGLKQYWRELLILCFLAPSPGLISLVFDISIFTAKFATVLLWYSGFEVARQGVFIAVKTAVVEVYSGCSGVEQMLQLAGLSVVFLVLFPTTKIQKFLVPIFALFIGFVLNGFRVAVLAVLANPSTKTAFEYWHKGDGSLLFSMMSVFSLGFFCLFLLRLNNAEDDDLIEGAE